MIYQVLETLASDNSRNFKISILKEHKDNELLKKVISLALDPFTNFYIRKIPEYSPAQTNQADTLDSVLDSLAMLSSRQVTGNAAIAHLTKLLSLVVERDAKVIERIIAKDLKCGVSEATVNNVWPGLIRTFDVCLAHKDISHIEYPAFAQVKADGGRCHIHFDGKKATAYSRNGKVIEFHGVFDHTAGCCMRMNEVWDGEIVFYKDDKALDRKTSNGLFNKGVKGTISLEEAMQARFICWDIIHSPDWDQI